MDDSSGKTASSWTIAEKKKTQRPGGCVGIFVQLFDWNRRFAKKKFFSRKLLAPSRAKQVSKMPASKLHLISDENSGGFPSMKKNVNRSVDSEHKHELRAPSLVARLMGLESMPAILEKPKKALITDACDSGEKTCVNNNIGSDREDLNLEKGSAKPESRPQKLQKMVPYEKRAVTRFGAEAFQIKSVLSRSRKHHSKLTPMKSPRIPSGKNALRTSRLIDAATRILEPGLQSTSRAKSAITNSRSFDYPCMDGVVDGTAVQSPENSKQTCYNAGAAHVLMVQTSCKSCGNLVDVVDLTSKEEEQHAFPSCVSNVIVGSSLVEERSKLRSSISCFGQEKDASFQGILNQPLSISGQKRIRSLAQPVTERKCAPTEGQASWQMSSGQQSEPRNEESSFRTLKNRSQMQHCLSLERERIPPGSKFDNLDSRRASSAAKSVRGTKDFISLNRNLSGRAQPKVPTKVTDSKYDTERKPLTGKDDYPSHLRTRVWKRRSNVSGQVENSGFVSSTAKRHGNVQFDAPTAKGLSNGAPLMTNTSAKGKLAGQRDGYRTKGHKNTDVSSFTFNSPIMNKTGIYSDMEGTTSMDNGHNTYLQTPLPMSGDSIGAFLEQKLRELACQEDDYLATGSSPKRSTAIILQELISALTAARSLAHDEQMASTHIVSSSAQGKMDRSDGIFCDGEYRSPGSVLDASFSSSSLDDSSEHRSVYPHSVDYSGDQLQPLGRNADLGDSAISMDRKKTGVETVAALFNNISRILHSIDAGVGRLAGDKFTHANEVVLNAELLFGDVSMNNMDAMGGFFICPLLFDLEDIASSLMISSNVFSDFGDTKEGNKLSEFLFDCVIEYLDSKYSRYCNSGFRCWNTLPVCMNHNLMIRQVEEEIQKWTRLVGMVPDEIIEWKMSHSLGKWTDFDIEAFETGSEIGGNILQILVNEVVIDLCECRLGSF